MPDELWAAPEANDNARGPGLDVLLTKAAVEFQTLRSNNADMAVKRNCESLRGAFGTDTLFIALFDAHREYIEHVTAQLHLAAHFILMHCAVAA